MFKQKQLSILQWFILIILMSIPIVNIIFLIWGFLKNKFSENLKNFIIAYFIFFLIFGGSFLGLR